MMLMCGEMEKQTYEKNQFIALHHEHWMASKVRKSRGATF